MRSRTLFASLLLVAPLAACAGGSGPGSMSPPALAYAVPPGGAATYLQSDTVQLQIDAGGQFIDVTVLTNATLDMVFAGGGDSIEVNTTFREFDLAASNPMAGTERADESDIEGPMVFTIDRTGAGTLVSAPVLSDVAAQGLGPEAMAAGFFPRLPGRAVSAGEMWTDTVTMDADDEGMATEGTTIYDFTAVGDTVVDGRSYLKVTFTTFDERTMRSEQMGAEIIQDVAGDGEGFYLWDASRNLVVQQFLEARLQGTMEVSMAPMPLGVEMVVAQHLTLDGGG